MRRRLLSWALVLTLLALAMPPAWAETKAEVPVEEFTLDNGMKFLLVQRPELATVSAGWVARVGSVNERPGITGMSHLFEHMMFKGTHVIGTTDIERDLQILDEQEALQTRIREIYREQRKRWRRGEIDDPFASENRTEELIALEKKFDELIAEQREIMIKDEFDQIYTEAGASGMNAGTSEDFTIYFITVPANKLELWFWMESDRLLNPVFREFYAERDVVHEERRLRTESTPTGKFREQFNAMFWESHPYSWPVVGWPSDLRVISKQQADDYYATFYAPNNLTAALVGNFDVDEVKALAERYYGRLPSNETSAPDVPTLEMEQLAEKRMTAECDCQPQIDVQYHTVAFMHVDSYALDVLAELMNGRTGRLYKSLVLDQEIASNASAGQSSDKYAGSFSFSAETKGEATPQQLEDGWYAELHKIIDEEIPAQELQKVKNQIQANAFRQLESPFWLLLQLLFYDNGGDWKYINEWSAKTLAVTGDDVKRVAKQYLTKENRAVGHYSRKEGAAAEDFPPELAELPGDQQQMVKQQLRQLRQIQDPGQLQQILAQIEQQKGAAPPQFVKGIEIMEKWIRERIEELSAQGGE
jgi:predicted Zn-dependent peptidase